MATYSIFIILAIPPPNRAGNENKFNMLSTPPTPPPPPPKKKIGEVTILWLGMENEFWLENTRLRLISNFNNYVTAMQFLFQIHLLILWPNSCTDVALRARLVSSLGAAHPSRYPRLEPESTIGHEVFSTRCFLILFSIFFCAASLLKKMKSKRSDVVSLIRIY